MDTLRDFQIVQKKQDIFSSVGLLRKWPPMAANIVVTYLTSWVDNFNYNGVICI